MSLNNPVQASVTDMLKVEQASMEAVRQSVMALLQEMREDRRVQQERNDDLTKLSDLLKDFIQEFDRLTARVSDQIKALLMVVDELQGNSSPPPGE